MSTGSPQRLLDLVSRAAALLGSPSVDRVLPEILATAAATVAADGYAIWRFDCDREAWRMASHSGRGATFAVRLPEL